MPNPKQTKQDGEDTKLILYRLDKVESAVSNLGTKIDRQDNIKRQDLVDFRETIITRVTQMQADFQRQINDKADATAVADLKKLIGSVGVVLGSIIGALVVFYITNRR